MLTLDNHPKIGSYKPGTREVERWPETDLAGNDYPRPPSNSPSKLLLAWARRHFVVLPLNCNPDWREETLAQLRDEVQSESRSDADGPPARRKRAEPPPAELTAEPEPLPAPPDDNAPGETFNVDPGF